MASIVMIFMVILATNLIDKDNFSKVEESVESIYEDVLLTKERIFELSMLVHEMEVAYLLEDKTYYEIKAVSSQERIQDILGECDEVVETKQEENVLIDLHNDFDKLFLLKADSTMFQDDTKKEVVKQFELIKYSLVELGEIHVEEGRRHKLKSRSVMSVTKLFSRIEIYILLILSVAILFVVMFQPREKDDSSIPME